MSINSVFAQTQTLMLGESLNINLRSDDTFGDYKKLDLTPLKTHFKLDDSSQTSDRIRLVLTPKQAGQIEIPQISSGGLTIPAQILNVKPNEQVNIEWQLPRSILWQGEWAVWRAKVTVKDAGLPVAMEALDTPDILYSAQALAQTLDNQRTAEFVLVQRLANTSPKLTPPVIRVQNRQGLRWQFFAPENDYQIQPLPSYVPAQIPVGEFSWLVNRPLWNRTGALETIELTLSGMNASRLPDLGDRMTSGEGINWLTAQTSTTENLGLEGRTETQTLNQPYRIMSSGWGYYPEIRLQYIDPETGKLVDLIQPAELYIALPAWLYWVGYVVLMFVGIGLLMVSIKFGKIGFYRVRRDRALAHTTDALARWQIYQAWGQARGLGLPQTHQAWLDAYESKFGINSALRAEFEDLDRQLYR
ncbi:MAG: hypothetical protein IBX48_04285 [Thiomicrospira sp.]|uniref:hypothetical protein n=1 Tax=Thiomicrospira sp. TaxID=935 RepID=UPI001A0347FF|nr:hypothetical protein [Thiomicrospira sp.]MBE0493540.1 hypothetical protein [Thiomicrospira sp.]